MYSNIEEIRGKIYKIILQNSNSQNVQDLSEDTDLINDLQLGSIRILKLIVAIEKEFKMFFPIELLNFNNTLKVGVLVSHVYEELSI